MFVYFNKYTKLYSHFCTRIKQTWKVEVSLEALLPLQQHCICANTPYLSITEVEK